MSVTQTQVVPAFRRTTETFAAGAKTLEQKYFVSPEIFAEEQEKIFSRCWMLVGHQSQIGKGVDYFTAQVAGESLIIIRDQRGTVRGFYNVCRHRGTRLRGEQNGHLAAIQCPYHAWTYGLDGRLIGAPHMDDVEGFDKADYSLHAVNLALWEGFIFVNLADGCLLEKVFAPLSGRFSHCYLPKLRSAKRTPYDSAENDLSEGPFLGGFMRIAKGNSLTMTGNSCALPVGDIKGEGHNRVFYYSIFPNMLLSMHPDYVMVHQLWPKSPERTLIFCDWFFHPEAFDRTDFHPDDAIEFWDMTNRQDWHVCKFSQQGIASPAYR